MNFTQLSFFMGKGISLKSNGIKTRGIWCTIIYSRIHLINWSTKNKFSHLVHKILKYVNSSK